MVLRFPSLKSLWSGLRLSRSPESKPKARAGSRPPKPLTLNTIAAAAVSEESLPFAEPKSPRGAPKGSTAKPFGVMKNQPRQQADRTSSNRPPPNRAGSNRPTPNSSPQGSPESGKTTTIDYTGQVERVGPVDATHTLLDSYPAKVNGDTDMGRVTVIVPRAVGSGLDELKSQAWRTAVREQARQKTNALKKYDGPFVKYIGFLNIDGNPAVLKEFIESTSAKEHLAKKSMKEKEKRQLILGFAQALEALHMAGGTHGSIEPHHFIVDKKGRPIIDGWWFNRLVEEELEKVGTSDDYRGPARYTAPEVLGSKKTGIKSDVYSFAVVAIELMTGKKPFTSTEQEAAVIGLINRGTSPFGKDDAELRNDPWWPTLEKCLSKDPADRPLMNKVSQDLSTMLLSSNSTSPGRTVPNRTTSKSSPQTFPESRKATTESLKAFPELTKATTVDYTGQVGKVVLVGTANSLPDSYPATVNGNTDPADRPLMRKVSTEFSAALP